MQPSQRGARALLLLGRETCTRRSAAHARQGISEKGATRRKARAATQSSAPLHGDRRRRRVVVRYRCCDEAARDGLTRNDDAQRRDVGVLLLFRDCELRAPRCCLLRSLLFVLPVHFRCCRGSPLVAGGCLQQQRRAALHCQGAGALRMRKSPLACCVTVQPKTTPHAREPGIALSFFSRSTVRAQHLSAVSVHAAAAALVSREWKATACTLCTC